MGPRTHWNALARLTLIFAGILLQGCFRLASPTRPADAQLADREIAAVVDAAGDTGNDTANDISSDAAGDSGSTQDAGPDAASNIVFADDFDDSTFADDWILRNASATQTGGALVSGTSCMCSGGPMLLYTRDLFDVGDGRMTIDYDVYTGVNARFGNRVIVDLEAEVVGRRIAANPDGSTRDLDPMLRNFFHIGGTEPFHQVEVCARCHRPDPVSLSHMDDFIAADDTWYHFELRFCGAAGMGIRITSMAGAVLLEDYSALLNASFPPAVTQVYVLLWIEGAGKRIDNLVIRRGCS